MNYTSWSSSAKLIYNSPKGQLAWIEVLVVIIFLLSITLHPIAYWRRSRKSSVLKVIALGANGIIILLIPYTFGLMRNLNLKNNYFSIWGILLFYMYFNAPNIIKLRDHQSTWLSVMKLFFYVFYVVTVLPSISDLMSQLIFCLFMYVFLLSYVNCGGALMVLTSITGDDRINVAEKKLIQEYSHGVEDTHEVDSTRPAGSRSPWLSCKYPVFRFKGKPPITVGEIWGCEELISMSSTSTHIKNICLSFSLFKRLTSRFRGTYSYKRSQQEETWKLVKDGLLVGREIGGNDCPFRMIEVEFTFLHDILYNNNCAVLYTRGFLIALNWYFVRFSSFLMMIAILLPNKKYHPKEVTLSIQIGGKDVAVLITWFIVIVSTLLDLGQNVILLRSRWFKMELLRSYFNKKLLQKKNVSIPKIISGQSWGRGNMVFNPWQRQLGQYSLLHKCSSMQNTFYGVLRMSSHLLFGQRFMRPGRSQSKNASLTNEIKEAVIRTLIDHGPLLANGISSLQASDELQLETKTKLLHACTRETTDVEVVLLWHIATSLCEIKQNQQGLRKPYDKDVRVATTLSKYCAYLVAFAPDMLPGHLSTSDNSCIITIQFAYDCLKKRTQENDIYQTLMDNIDTDGVDIESDDPHSPPKDDGNIVKQGAVLGKVLIDEIQDPIIRWEVLANFWSEMILYLAPNMHNELDHLERLEDGGEFITHLWALLFHAGIVDRDSSFNNSRNAASPIT